MPMFNGFVPRRIQPWIYVVFALLFQLSASTYGGAVAHLMGDSTMMREDALMIVLCGVVGVNMPFPFLFRFKFRFTNQQLLMTAAVVIGVCNVLSTFTESIPVLCAISYVAGFAKLCGTFECMSNIQLWITPKRDFTVFFPALHVILLGSMQFSDLIATHFMYYWHWSCMHWFIAALMLVDLLIVRGLTRHFRIIKKLPLYGIDWLGALLWALLLLEIAYFFNYGDFYDWFASPVMRMLAVAVAITLVACLWRMFTIRHPFYEPKMWTYKHLVPILVLIALTEAFLATEHVLEEAFSSEVMHYDEMVSVRFDWAMLAGVWSGCLFSYWWMHVRRFNYIRLLTVGMAALALYLGLYYFLLSADLHISQLYWPTVFRGFSYAILSATFMVCLDEIMTFQHFFQALSVFNMLHMVMGGVMGAALYTRAFRYYMADNMARYGAWVDNVALGRMPASGGNGMERFSEQVMEISIKQIYGWTLYVCLFVLLLFLLYKVPVRRHLKPIPGWRALRREVASVLSR